MDARPLSSSKRPQSRSRRRPLRAFVPRNPPSREYGDRFIPNRSSMDFDMAHYLLTQSSREKEIEASGSPSKELYRKLLRETLMMDRTRILSFKNKPPRPTEQRFLNGASPPTIKPLKQRQRHIPQKPEKILDAPDLIDDFYLNLLDWGNRNILSIALGNFVHLWNGLDGSVSELMSVGEEIGPVTSVSWAPEGRHLAVGLNNSDIQLWDSESSRLLRTLRGVHESRVGSLCWNGHILTTGGADGKIVNNDVRARSHTIQTYQGHEQEVCGLKWSSSGQQLASGGNDNLLHIWDLSVASSNLTNQNQWLHRFEDHTSAVKALAWCPFQTNLLASGGGDNDRCIKFWNTHTGTCLKSVHTCSQVCSLIWNKNERELLSSHGFTENQLILWKYPSMDKIAELHGHISRVLFMAQSPDGYTVASAAGGMDESLRLWKVFGDHDVPDPAVKRANIGPFADYSFIR